MPTFNYRSQIDVPAAELCAWHLRPGAFERLIPPWEQIEVLERQGGVADGGRVILRMRRGPFPIRWIAQHGGYEAGRQFVDEQVAGPFARWRHTHRFLPDGENRSFLEDQVEYKLPLGPAGQLLGGRHVRKTLQRLFAFRHARTRHDLLRQKPFAARGPQRIVLSGASGLIGVELAAFLRTAGHRVVSLVRRPPVAGGDEIYWNPAAGEIDAAALEGVDAVVHLAGESIAGRWTPARKEAIRKSRVVGTLLLCAALARLRKRPQVLISASAIGYYGNRGDEVLTEDSDPGTGFLPDVCQAWETATNAARQGGVRVVNLRIGVVLSPRGGALATMRTPFKLGAGGAVGGGGQYMSWIALDDVVGAIQHALFTHELSGPVNATAPAPATNREFTKTLGRVLRRPTVLPAPAFAVRALLGEMGQTLLLEGARALPARLQASGFQFLHPDLESALRGELGLEQTTKRSRDKPGPKR